MLLSEKGIVKFADFGLARKYSAENLQMTHGVVTRWYRPPEILYGSKNYGPSVDIWSLGCLLGELMLREPLFPGSSEIDQLTKIFTLRGSADVNKYIRRRYTDIYIYIYIYRKATGQECLCCRHICLSLQGILYH